MSPRGYLAPPDSPAYLGFMTKTLKSPAAPAPKRAAKKPAALAQSTVPTPADADTAAAAPDEAGKTLLDADDAGDAAAAPAAKGRDRWPEAVMARGYATIPSILFWGQANLGLSPDQFNVLLQLVSHWWTKDVNPHPSKETIARRMGKDPRTVQRHLTALEDAGFIKRKPRYKLHKGQDSNGYDLRGLVRKLKAIAPEFEKVSDQNKRRRAKVEGK